ncbi:MAG: hypothetical protein PUB21_07270 [Bacteroidales bacterium]|nr:hypothetical protein [Bacteroidales bacterium]
MRKITALMSVAILFAMTLFFSSCEKDEITDVYGYGIYSLQTSSFTAFGIVQNYMQEKGCQLEATTFTSEKTSDNNNKAIALFNASVAKINEAELKTLLNGEKITFTYGVVTASTIPGAETNYLGKKEYVFE